MTISKISSTDLICKLSQQLNRIGNVLDANLLNEFQRIALIFDLKDIFLKIENETRELETRLTILGDESTENHKEIEFDLLAIKKIKGVWEGIYHNCMRGQISSLTQICNKTEIALAKHSTDPFSNFPEEILVQLFSFLSPQELARLSKCNKYLYNLCQDNTLWKHILQKESSMLSIPDGKSVKELYKSIQQQLKALRNEELYFDLFSGQHKNNPDVDEDNLICELHIDGNLSFSGFLDGTCKIWDSSDIANIQCIATFKGHSASLSSIHKDGNRLFGGFSDGTIKAWDLSDLSNIFCLSDLKEHSDAICCIKSYGNVLFSGSTDGVLNIWDLTNLSDIYYTPNRICSSKKHADPINITCLLKEGNFLFAGYGNIILVLELSDLIITQRNKLEGHRDGVTSLYKEGDLLFSHSIGDNTMKVWDLITKQCIYAFEHVDPANLEH